jgi:hypothetical protein
MFTKNDFQVTKNAYFRVFKEYRSSGLGFRQAFDRTEEMCSKSGCRSYYSSFESFKRAFYKKS